MPPSESPLRRQISLFVPLEASNVPCERTPVAVCGKQGAYRRGSVAHQGVSPAVRARLEGVRYSEAR